MKVFFSRLLLYVILITVAVMASACQSGNKALAVEIFSAQITGTSYTAPESTLQPTMVFLSIAQKDLGYQKAAGEATETAVAQPQQDSILKMELDFPIENSAQQKNIADTVHTLLENDGKGQSVIALVGATDNEKSMRLASLSNFFKVPMIIPSNVGDGLLPSNNFWGFRLSAPGSSHAQYLFGSVLARGEHLVATPSPTPGSEPDISTMPTLAPYKIAILYEQTTFGESAAVAAAKEAMKQNMEIGFYGSYNPSYPDPAQLKKQVQDIHNQSINGNTWDQTKAIRLIYLVSSQPHVAYTVIKSLAANIPSAEMPVLLGQSDAFSSREFLHEFLDSVNKMPGIFVLRQKVITNKCPLMSSPTEIQNKIQVETPLPTENDILIQPTATPLPVYISQTPSLTEAQNYAAIQLLRLAVNKAKENIGNAGKTFASLSLTDKRDAVRNALTTFNQELPCLGQVSFDNTGQNKNLQFEILQITSQGLVLVDENTFRNALEKIQDSSNNPFDIDN